MEPLGAIALRPPPWESCTATLAGQVLSSRDKDWTSLKCGFGVWGLGMQSLPLVVPKTAFRLKCWFDIHLILEIKDLMVELGMKPGVQVLL